MTPYWLPKLFATYVQINSGLVYPISIFCFFPQISRGCCVALRYPLLGLVLGASTRSSTKRLAQVSVIILVTTSHQHWHQMAVASIGPRVRRY